MTNDDNHPVPGGKGKTWWKNLSNADKELHTFWRFEAGHRNNEVMAALDLSVGTVAGMKNRWRTQKDAKERAAKKAARKSRRAAKKTADVMQPTHEPDTPVMQPVQESNMQMAKSYGDLIHEPEGDPSPGFLGRMTSSWQKQCGHVGDDNRQCGFHFTFRRGEEKRCNVHKDELN
jgi:hypothetical protein